VHIPAAAAMPDKAPLSCTVLVPSYNRLPSALELLERLRGQDYPDFEILVVEQSTSASPEDLARLEALARADARIRVEKHPPLGVGGARNVGMRSARGDVVLIIDDDDLPEQRDWISRHMANYDDPDCIAVHGSERREGGGGGVFERRFPKIAHRLAMSYSPFGTPMAFPGLDERKVGCAYLRGGNSSIRRAWALRAAGWVDECGNGQEEHDFSFRLRKLMRPGQYIVFDPTARMIRRMDIAGGADRRTGTLGREIEGNIRFYFGVIRRHRPVRTTLLLPLYPWVIFGRAVGWILDDRAHEPTAVKVKALAHLAASYPVLFTEGLVRFVRGPVRRPAPAAVPGPAADPGS
jgi:glycosyltransferase involved in cell wall biosynthesis